LLLGPFVHHPFLLQLPLFLPSFLPFLLSIFRSLPSTSGGSNPTKAHCSSSYLQISGKIGSPTLLLPASGFNSLSGLVQACCNTQQPIQELTHQTKHLPAQYYAIVHTLSNCKISNSVTHLLVTIYANSIGDLGDPGIASSQNSHNFDLRAETLIFI
jgi:hypothetical protein